MVNRNMTRLNGLQVGLEETLAHINIQFNIIYIMRTKMRIGRIWGFVVRIARQILLNDRHKKSALIRAGCLHQIMQVSVNVALLLW